MKKLKSLIAYYWPPIAVVIVLAGCYVYAEERACPGLNESCYTSRWR